MDDILNQLVGKGATTETIHYLVKSLSDGGDSIDCEFTKRLLKIKDVTNIDNIYRCEISKYLINKAFNNVEAQFRIILENNNIDDSTRQLLRIVGSTVLLLPDISNSQHHLTMLAAQVLDVLAYHVNTQVKRTCIVGHEYEGQYNIILTLISNVKTFISELPALDNEFKNAYCTYLDCAIALLRNYISGIHSLHQVISQIFMAYQQNIPICVNCDTCEQKDDCKHKIDRPFH